LFINEIPLDFKMLSFGCGASMICAYIEFFVRFSLLAYRYLVHLKCYCNYYTYSYTGMKVFFRDDDLSEIEAFYLLPFITCLNLQKSILFPSTLQQRGYFLIDIQEHHNSQWCVKGSDGCILTPLASYYFVFRKGRSLRKRRV
jgi:hypothetical protein